MIMSAQEILTLAQQGHPTAIATLINFVTQPQGIRARVQRRSDRLYVLLESKQTPVQAEAVAFVRSSLEDLNVEPIQALIIYGRQQGENAPAWQQTISLETAEVDEYILNPGSTDANTMPEGMLAPFSAVDTPQLVGTAPRPLLVGSPDENKVLKRPEAVIFLIFISIILFWDTYLSLLDEQNEKVITAESALTTSQLARRLRTAKGTIRRQKRGEGFGEWTQQRDPEGIAWAYHRGAYVPASNL
ncbi:MAG: hypothetical protein Kow00121_62950 [Elainellaceae cyanobacterium]